MIGKHLFPRQWETRKQIREEDLGGFGYGTVKGLSGYDSGDKI